MIPLAILLAGVLIAGAVVFAAHFERVLRARRRHRVIVTCKGGASWRGVLYDFDRRTVVLRSAERLGPSAEPVPVDGELLVERADVEFMQRF